MLAPVDRQPEPPPQVLEGLLVLGGEALAELDEVGPRDRRPAPCPAGRRRAARSPGRRGATGRSAPRSSSAPGARWAGRCRPSPSGRRPRSPACAGSGRWRRCGCREHVADVQRARTPSAAGVSMEKTCVARRRAGRSGRCPSSSQRGAHAPRGPRARLVGQPRRLSSGRIRSSSAMIGLPYPACCASTTPPRATVAPARACASRARCRCTCAARPSTTSPPRPRPVHPGLRHPAPLPDCSRARRALRLERHRHRRQDHRPGRRPRARRPSEVAAEYEAGVVGGHGRASACCARPRSRTPPRTSSDMVELIGELVDQGPGLRDGDGVYLVGVERRRLRPAGPPVPRLAAGRRPGRGATRSKRSPARLRAVEEGQAGRADAGRRRGGRPARAGTPSAW